MKAARLAFACLAALGICGAAHAQTAQPSLNFAKVEYGYGTGTAKSDAPPACPKGQVAAVKDGVSTCRAAHVAAAQPTQRIGGDMFLQLKGVDGESKDRH